MPDSFPRQQARTQRFSLGAPRSARVSPDGGRVAFLRSPDGEDARTSLWVLDVASGVERLALDAADVASGVAETAEERARRERVRERAAGITSFATDRDLRRAVVVVGATAWSAPLGTDGDPVRLDLPTAEVFDARPSPAGDRLAWCAAGDLWVCDLDGRGGVVAGSARSVATRRDAQVRWGQAEFVAAEEMGRTEGHWWSPDGATLLAARVDDGPVRTAWVADPAHPERPPVPHRYPFAGTPDADVTLWLLDLSGGGTVEVRWDRAELPYLPEVRWPAAGDGRPLLVVERRDHRRAVALAVDPVTGQTEELAERTDEAWVAWVPGTPDRLPDGRLLWSSDGRAGAPGGTRRLTVDDAAVTPEDLVVRAVLHVGADVHLSAWPADDPTTVGLWRLDAGGSLEAVSAGGVVLSAAAGGPTVVVAERRLDRPGTTTTVHHPAGATPIASHAAQPVLVPSVSLRALGPDRLRAGLLLPAGHEPGRRLPVLLRPYGGPGAQMVTADHHAWLEHQWWADQGFAVLVVDGRGTPGRGPAWERAVHLDLAGPVLDDQVAALEAVAAEEPDLDTGRVGIMGWSFGGYLAALAVLRRPDVFHAAVAGAPVTEWRLYDTYYTERLLGHPGTDPEPYDRCSLLPLAAGLRRPLMAIHGLVDDNVVVAHTLQLSQRLLEAGRPHTVLPLTGATHMPTQEDVAEHLLDLQRDFLVAALGAVTPG